MKEKEITLNDLKQTEKETAKAEQIEITEGMNSNGLVEVNPYELKPKKVEEEKNVLVSDAFESLMNVTDRISKEVDNFHEQKRESDLEDEIEKGLDDEDDMEDEIDGEEEVSQLNFNNTKEEEKKVINIPGTKVIELDENDFKELDDEIEEDSTDFNENQFNMMKSELKKAIKPVQNKIDLAKFSISKKPVSVTNALKAVTNEKIIVDWGLFTKGEVVAMSEFKGVELEKLNPNFYGRNRINAYGSIYNLIYSHIMNPNKPTTMEEWVKGVPFYDLDHLYFAIYKASYFRANYIPYECTHCKHVFVSQDVNIDDMVKFKDEENKAKALDMLNKEALCVPNEVNIDLYQASDNYVFGLKDPSIFNIVFENIVLEEKFITKYADLLEKISYIDSIYLIDHESQTLRPIEVKQYPNEVRKSVKSKVSRFAAILAELDSDQLNAFEMELAARDESHDEITYRLPEMTCPKCGKKIEEKPMRAEDLLFTRHQLARIANM